MVYVAAHFWSFYLASRQVLRHFYFRYPGGDAKAIAEIADKHYGSYKQIFEKHEWEERGSDMRTTSVIIDHAIVAFSRI